MTCILERISWGVRRVHYQTIHHRDITERERYKRGEGVQREKRAGGRANITQSLWLGEALTRRTGSLPSVGGGPRGTEGSETP